MNTCLSQSLMASGAASAAVQIPVGMCLLGGILLTLFGTRLLKPLYVLIFAAAIGTLCSLLAPNFMSDRVAGVPSPVIGVGVGAMLGSLLAVLTFRFALSLTTAATLGVVAFLGAAVYLSLMPAAQGGMGLDGEAKAAWVADLAKGRAKVNQSVVKELSSVSRDRAVAGVTRLVTSAKDSLGGGEGKAGGVASVGAKLNVEAGEPGAAEAARGILDSLFGEIRAVWARLPGESRMVLIASAMAGLMLGFVLGVVAPLKAGAVLTSMAGAMLCVVCGGCLLTAAGVIRPSLFDRGPLIWLSLWGGVAIAGFVYQLPRQKAKPREVEATA